MAHKSQAQRLASAFSKQFGISHAAAYQLIKEFDSKDNPKYSRKSESSSSGTCTGYIEPDSGHLVHDGDTCPVHEESRFWWMVLDKVTESNLAETFVAGKLVGIVDEAAGGIIAYANGSEHAESIVASLANASTQDKYYVLGIEGGIHAELSGPYASEAERDAAGASIYNEQDPETDGCFAAEVINGKLSIDSASFGE